MAIIEEKIGSKIEIKQSTVPPTTPTMTPVATPPVPREVKLFPKLNRLVDVRKVTVDKDEPFIIPLDQPAIMVEGYAKLVVVEDFVVGQLVRSQGIEL